MPTAHSGAWMCILVSSTRDILRYFKHILEAREIKPFNTSKV